MPDRYIEHDLRGLAPPQSSSIFSRDAQDACIHVHRRVYTLEKTTGTARLPGEQQLCAATNEVAIIGKGFVRTD